MLNKFLAILIVIAVLAAIFFIFSLILLGAWNYVIPRLITSIDATAANMYTNIDYVTAMVFAILVFVLFGQSVVFSATVWLFDFVTATTSDLTGGRVGSRFNRATRKMMPNEQYEMNTSAW
jgi:uncharacterized membrane protein YedE/YeeE